MVKKAMKVYLDAEQYLFVKILSEKKEISMSESLRCIIDDDILYQTLDKQGRMRSARDK